MVFISEIHQYFPYVEPTREMVQDILHLYEVLPFLLNQLPPKRRIKQPSRTDFLEMMDRVHGCAMKLLQALSTLPMLLNSIAYLFVAPEWPDIDRQPDNYYLGRLHTLENLTKLVHACEATSQMLRDIDKNFARALAYLPGVHQVMMNVVFPFAAKYRMRLSPRAVMLTSGRATLAVVRDTVDRLRNLAAAFMCITKDVLGTFDPHGDVLREIRARSWYWRSALQYAVHKIGEELEGMARAIFDKMMTQGWSSCH
ncbi:hypothetical protein HDZ31DRAFT_63723 [Schizophyllum fasciatum]